jgi:hypothetical protein
MYASLYSAWYICYSNYFFFPTVYVLDDIQGHVQKYAPLNKKGKKDFAFVTTPHHINIFYKLLKAVENNGDGLEDITYPVGEEQKRFLTDAEVVHLKDVANLLASMRSYMQLNVFLLAVVVFCMVRWKVWPYYTTGALGAVVLLSALGTAFVWKVGFVKVFYALHTMVFPSDHQWFFYYQESLMSTLLKAPDSFIAFGVLLGVFTLTIFCVYFPLSASVVKKLISRFR